MEQELESLNQQMQAEIKQIRDKYNSLKKECRARHKPKTVKKKRSAIPKALKNEVWDNSIGREKGVGHCYCCSKEIDSKHFECGHIIAVSNGGTNTLQNLKPLCSLCNKSMGSQNLEEFKNNYMSHVMENKHKNTQQNMILPGFYDFNNNDSGFQSILNPRSQMSFTNNKNLFQNMGNRNDNGYINNYF